MTEERETLSKVIKAVCRFKGGSSYVLAQELGVSREIVDKAISFLLGEGLLKELRIKGGCESCPLSKICPYSSKGGPNLSNVPLRIRVYVLTDKGKTFCKNLFK